MWKLVVACVGAIVAAVNAAEPYSTWMTDSIISRGVQQTRWYTEATFYMGVQKVYNATGRSSYMTFLETQINAVVNSSGAISGWDSKVSTLDDILIGRPILFLYGQTGLEKYKTVASFLRSKLDTHSRNPSGGFWHKVPAYPDQMWLDGLFMASAFYAQYTATFDAANDTAWNDIVLQFDLVEAHCRNATTGLLVHGYDESKKKAWADPVTGASPHVWDRAVGWYFMALVEVLDWFPTSHPGRAKLLNYLTTLAAGLKKAQDSSGGWWLVMDEPYPGMKGNYIESSATAMFTYVWLKGIRKGYFAASDYKEPAFKAYSLMTDRFVAHNGTGDTLNWEGTVIVGSLTTDASFKYYTSQKINENDLKGAGPFVYASVEIEAMGT